MQVAEAVELIRPAVGAPGGSWADFGAGSGLFTRALAVLLGPAGRVVAVERDPRALAALRASAPGGAAGAEIVTVEGDFRDLDAIGELAPGGLDGALFANALHFAPDADRVLRAVTRRLRAAGRLVVIEYEGRPPSRWVPYPVSLARLRELAAPAGLEPPRVVGERPSSYGGIMYCAVLERPGT